MTVNTIVTGVSSGIGQAVAEMLLSEGRCILGISRRVVEFSVPEGSRYTHEQMDLSDLQALKTRLPELAKRYRKIDAIVFCAGYGRFGGLEEFSYDQITDLVNTNLIGQIFLTRAFLPEMKRRRQGRLVYISSESVLSGGRRGAVYTASKSAIHGFVKSLRRECSSDGVHASVIIPGMVESGFYDQAEFTHGEDASNHLLAVEVAQVVETVLKSRDGAVFDEILMTPLKSVIRRKREP